MASNQKGKEREGKFIKFFGIETHFYPDIVTMMEALKKRKSGFSIQMNH
jgi:hypothetical protein